MDTKDIPYIDDDTDKIEPSIEYDAKLPTVDINVEGPSIKGPKVDDMNISGQLPNIGIDINTPKIKAEGPDADFNADVKGGIKGFFKGIGGKIKTPEVHLADVKRKGEIKKERNVVLFLKRLP